jgi:ABC-type dipeptide/oligopeptide/nickel transport system permease subunit
MAVADLELNSVTTSQEGRSLWRKSLDRLLRNKLAVASAILIILMILVAIFAKFLTPYTFAEQDLLANNAIPEWMLFLMPEGAENYARISDQYPLSADHLGRDILTRTFFGARVSLTIAFAGSLVS